MKRAARARPKSSLCASVKISSNWSKISSGISVVPRLVAQHVVAVVQELPQRFALDRDAGLRPLARAPRGRAQIACLICSAGSGASRA